MWTLGLFAGHLHATLFTALVADNYSLLRFGYLLSIPKFPDGIPYDGLGNSCSGYLYTDSAPEQLFMDLFARSFSTRTRSSGHC
jgi:hypothetical protein